MNGGLDDFLTLHLVERLERVTPRLVVILIQQGCDSWQRLLTVGHHSHIGLHVLVDLTAVDIEMDDFGLLGIGLQIARHTVAEAHADGNEHIALLLLQIDGIVAVHAQHAHIERMVGRKGRKPQHRTTCGDVGFFQELNQFALCIAEFDPLPHKGQRLLGIVDELGSLTDSLSIELRIRHIGTHEADLAGLPVDLLDLRVLGKVEHHRTRTTRTGDVERTAHSPRHILSMTDLIAPLRDRLRHTYEVDLLKGIGTQGANGHLTGNHHNRRRVEHGISDTRQRVGDTRATGHQGDTHLTRYAGITLGSMGSSLLVTHEDMVETLLLTTGVVEKCVVDGHDTATGVSEDGLHPFCLQRPHQRL